MNYEWYESRSTATIRVFLSEGETPLSVKKEGGTLVVETSLSAHRISIVHAYEVGAHKASSKVLEIILQKPESKKWGSLQETPHLSFERAKEVKPGAETLSNDPILNMFMEVYANAPESVKQEMNKSFYESGGTELRTHKKDADALEKKRKK
ncbi:suppressor of G2 allele of SKP1 [Nematocida major]|uniref:suppressor of G2 allele of SKP1 n=1 Tax=Nematocida major TaxID=1912982 RepID=UPI00200858E6|nr:suppressor of G2 allele of SKP1 [Nematocida major]KAH9386598.1 suppressor of G2 allele of SKP1 [Nematocida major]